MLFESNMSILYSDTPIPEVFITEYMPSMDSNHVKVYIYCLFLNKHGKSASTEDISKKLDMDIELVKAALTSLEALGIISRDNRSIGIIDLKEKEIKRLYRPKNTSTPLEAAQSADRNKKRNAVIRDINNKYFQGVMSPTWYTDIDNWFDKYGFEEDVMFALFEHCYVHKGLSKQYISKVADNWKSKDIKNGFDLDKYYMEYQKLRDIKLKIMKKIRKQGLLTEYEEAYVEKWVVGYGYEFDIIELALKRTTSILNPNFEYINKILTDWHDNGLKSKEDIAEYEKARKQKSQAGSASAKGKEGVVPQKGNFEQTKYDKDYLEKLYKDV
jgi:DnaD/phage-associated family protein